MSEELIPQGLPHGERQQYEQQARGMGLQVDLPGTPPRGPMPQAPAPSPVGFDPLTTMKPTMGFGDVAAMQPQRTQQMVVEQAAMSTNPVVREIAQRYMRRRRDDSTA